jgi:hypothetical protein
MTAPINPNLFEACIVTSLIFQNHEEVYDNIIWNTPDDIAKAHKTIELHREKHIELLSDLLYKEYKTIEHIS